MNYFKPVIILKLRGRRRQGLCAEIPVPVLQVPAGEEGGPGGGPYLPVRSKALSVLSTEEKLGNHIVKIHKTQHNDLFGAS